MTEHTDDGDGHDRDDGEGEATASEVTAWHLVPTASAGTVPVEWTDLKTMRRRIDELERERDRLAARLEQSRERRRRTVERYEQLLDRRSDAETTRPQVTADTDGGVGRWRATDGSEAATPAVAADGGFDGAPAPDTGEDGTAGGPLSRLFGALAGLVSRG